MRDPKRIKKFLDRLGSLWELVSDWRFGQLVNNLQNYLDDDLFYLEEDQFLLKLWEMLMDEADEAPDWLNEVEHNE